MSSDGFKRKTTSLGKLFGIRARLALLALILVAPLMLERVRSLEQARNRQIALAYSEFSGIAEQSAERQREAISSVETVLKSAAQFRRPGRPPSQAVTRWRQAYRSSCRGSAT